MTRPIVLITGGAGFIGTNAAERWTALGWEVRAFDDLSRRGSELNVERLRRLGVRFVLGDVRHAGTVRRWIAKAGARTKAVFHLAGQVAVTMAVADPRSDFERNVFGSLNVLEAVRVLKPMPVVLYASTNKVYGELKDIEVQCGKSRYQFLRLPYGVPEEWPLHFDSPYGCSKGAADQYFLNYHRIYGVPSVVLRQSCVYGRYQHGDEDQGWVAHLMRAAICGSPITVYGDGRQMRDVLFCDDLLNLFEAACAHPRAAAGQAFNIGGGPSNSLSLLELIRWLNKKKGATLYVRRGQWRPGDQRVYVSDIRKARSVLGWRPRVSVTDGLERLWSWLSASPLR